MALAYVEVRAQQARIDVARRNLETQAETLQLTRWRAQAGLVGTLDVEQARTNYEQTRAQIPVLEAAARPGAPPPCRSAGSSPAALDAQAAPAPVPAAPARIALAIPAAVLRQRPDVEAAERALAAETARVGVAEAARYPSLSLGASIGLQALTPSGLFDPGTTVRSLFASFAGTVFDAGRLRQQVEIRSAVQAQALASNYESVVLAALEEVENALLAIAASRDRREALAAAVDAARNAALLARHRYASGLTDFQTVLDSGRTVRTLEDALASSDADAANAIVRLYKALGGGWSAAAAATADQDIEARQ